MKKKKKIIVIILSILVILGLVAAVLFRPVPFQVERSISIGAPVEKTFAIVADFNEWPQWSPWLVMEPGAKVTVSGDGKSVGDTYSWSGELVGEGEMEHVAIDVPKSTREEIRFIKPFPSTAKVGFRVAPDPANPNHSTATWLMDGKIPSVMKGMMAAWIGMDYERGLRMLKEYCETGTVVTETEINGEVEVPAMGYLGIEQECQFSNIPEAMGKSFALLLSRLEAAGIKPEGRFLSIYTEFDMVKGHITYLAAYPVPTKPDSLPEGVFYREMPTHRAFQVTHIGPFRNVGNGWSTGTQYLSAKKMKQSKSVMPYELIPVDETETPEAEIRIGIFFPLR